MHSSARGYLLPITIILGLGVSTVSLLGMQVVGQNSLTLNNQYYTSLAQEAAQAGISAAASCLRANDTTWSDSARTLTPATVCDGIVNASKPNTVADDQYVQSTYSVGVLQAVGVSATVVTSTGKASIKGPSGTLVKTFEATVRTYAKISEPITQQVSKPVNELSVGDATACVVASGWPYCWGSNSNTLLGTGKNYKDNLSSIPVAVARTAVAAGSGVCTAWDWFGNCTTKNPNSWSAQPANPMIGKVVTKISVGATHVCVVAKDNAVTTAGKAYCWGNNTYGQLGNRTNTSSSVPVTVDTAAGSALAGKSVVDVTAGNGFTCALDSTGDVHCWGANDMGQLGAEDTTDSNIPRVVSKVAGSVTHFDAYCKWWQWWGACGETEPAHDVVVIASSLNGKTVAKLGRVQNGNTMCVIDTTGQAHCWGDNRRGQVGDKNYDESTSESRSSSCAAGSPPPPASWTPTDLETATITKPVATLLTQPFDTIETHPTRTIAKTTASASVPNREYSWSDMLINVTNNTYGYSNCGTQGTGSGTGTGKQVSRRTISYTAKSTVPTTPLYDNVSGTTLNKKQISLSSGNAYNGLFCAITGSDAYCDPHSGPYAQGQTGSNYTTGTLSGPQRMYMDGWLFGKNIQGVGVGTDYGCILADNTVGCWGLNDTGQVGDSTTTNRKVITPIDISVASDLGELAETSSGARFENPINF